jgi:diketogulonate reductase-like aldo/keto reductase
VAVVAVALGWVLSTPIPEGTIFATVIPLVNKKLPGTIFGDWAEPGTPPVPADVKPSPRPKHELFLPMPSGAQMPANGLGMCCRATAYDQPSVKNTVLWYLLQGGRLIDTAELYLNHRAIGEGIKEAEKRGIPRSEIFVTTKLTPKHFSEGKATERVAVWLEELQLDYIDLVLVHAPSSMIPLPGGGPPCMTRGAPPTWKACRIQAWRALNAQHKKGVIRDIGVSNFVVRQLIEFQDLGLAPIAANQINWNPWTPEWQEEVFQFCQASNITVTAWASLQGTFMETAKTETVTTLKEIAASKSRSTAQILLRWALQKKASIIPGTGNPKHMKENLDIYSFELSESDMHRIDALRTDPSAKDMMNAPPNDT